MKNLRVFISVILSIALLLASIAFCAALTVQNSLEPANIKNVLKSEAVSLALADSLYSTLGGNRLPKLFLYGFGKLIVAVIDSPGFGAVLDEYIALVTNFAAGGQIEFLISDNAKQQLLQDAITAFEIMLAQFGIPETLAAEPKESLITYISTAVEQLPHPETVLKTAGINKELLSLAGYMLKPAVLYGCGAFMLIVSCAIALLISDRYRWMKYAAIPLLISGVLIIAAGVLAKPSVSIVFGGIERLVISIVNSFIDSVDIYFFIAGGAYILAAAVLFAFIYIMKKSAFAKRAKAA